MPMPGERDMGPGGWGPLLAADCWLLVAVLASSCFVCKVGNAEAGVGARKKRQRDRTRFRKIV